MERDEVLSPAALITWLIEKSLAGVDEAEIVGGFCGRLVHAGMPLARAIVLVDTLHPTYEGRAFRWSRGDRQAEIRIAEDYADTSDVDLRLILGLETDWAALDSPLCYSLLAVDMIISS